MSGKSSATPDSRLTVLYDGWPLVRSPSSAAALHLQELLALVPHQQVTPILILPGRSELSIPVKTIVNSNDAFTRSRLVWEQVILPLQARRLKADLIHLTTASAPLFHPVPCVVSPTEPVRDGKWIRSGRGESSRLRAAFGRGGLSQAGAVLWPTDLPAPPLEGPARHSLPPVSHPAFSAGVKDSFWQTEPESYVVAFGKFDSIVRLKRALAAWSWAAEALGEDWSLRVAGLSSAGDAQLQRLQAEMGIAGTIQAIHPHSVADSAHCLLRAGAVLNLGPVHPWGDRVLHTLAAGRPLAAEYDWGVNERVGPAAYVTPAGDSRALGAALLTLIVEESVATQVNQAAQERTAAWASEGFLDQLMTIYREVQAGEPRRITST